MRSNDDAINYKWTSPQSGLCKYQRHSFLKLKGKQFSETDRAVGEHAVKSKAWKICGVKVALEWIIKAECRTLQIK